MVRATPATWFAFIALAMCPVACFGDCACSDGDAATPCQDAGHQPCLMHACFCAGATRPSVGANTSVAVDPRIAMPPVADSADRWSLDALAFLERSVPITESPAARGVLPLLI
jgi:hypothetical protein